MFTPYSSLCFCLINEIGTYQNTQPIYFLLGKVMCEAFFIPLIRALLDNSCLLNLFFFYLVMTAACLISDRRCLTTCLWYEDKARLWLQLLGASWALPSTSGSRMCDAVLNSLKDWSTVAQPAIQAVQWFIVGVSKQFNRWRKVRLLYHAPVYNFPTPLASALQKCASEIDRTRNYAHCKWKVN